MNNELAQLAAKTFTRRMFLEGIGAVGATAALASCTGSGKGARALFDEAPVPAVPAIAGLVVPGAAPHNCGGRCVTKAYVENGVVKRLVTDERTDKAPIMGNGDDPQRRACPRCRAHKGYMYRADRLLKPLKQTGNRGDVNGFVEITWDQAFTEIATKLQAIATKYGPASLFNQYASGDGADVPNAAGVASRLLNLLGGSLSVRQDYSWPALEHMSWFVVGQNYYTPPGNARQDCFVADQIVMWSLNHGEAIWGTNSMWYTQQAKEKGIPLISVDSRVSQTQATLTDAAGRISPLPGTDSALILGMLNHLLSTGQLDEAFIRKYVHGFFDDNPANPAADAPYHPDVPAASYAVPPGASLSAYIAGNVKLAQNQAASIYPGVIGYSVRSDDPLYGKTVSIGGQVPKTPEWAAAICGVPADTIRSFANSLVTKKTTIWWGSGWNRGPESEQAIWLGYILGFVTKNFGQHGRMVGMYGDFYAGGFGMDAGAPNTVDVSSSIYDLNKLSAPTYTPAVTRNSIPVFLWTDAAYHKAAGDSEWNDGQIKALPTGIKAIMNFGGNALINQHGNVARSKAILADKSRVELIVVGDLYMTASAAWADYLLPVAAAYERTAATTTWLAGDNLIYMGKAVEPLGQAKDDYDIMTGIAEKLGSDKKAVFTGNGKTAEDWVKYGWDSLHITSMSYDQWKQAGIYSTSTADTSKYGVAHDQYLANPTANPLATPSGRVEAFSQALVEDYEARRYGNKDQSVTLLNGGQLFDPSGYTAAAKTTKTAQGRFVYPIPMYIPLAEGRHADEVAAPHDDPLGARKAGYDLMLHTFHIQYRSHSTHNNNAYLDELYKKDAQGEPAFLSPQRSMGKVWDDGVYEPVWINPADAQVRGVIHGDRVKLTSLRGSIYASANVTNRAHPGVLNLGQGSWHQLDAHGVDVGGCANTLTSQRPSRIGQGMTLGHGTLVKLEKA
jgi:anaerobic dimethyl sulfoxide reductase subunit A